jgi:tetratricopeptide (TPR) repeat protein
MRQTRRPIAGRLPVPLSLNVMADRTTWQRLMRHALLEEAVVYESEDEFRDAVREGGDNALVERRRLALTDNPREQAQELAYQAYEAEDAEQALALAEQALAVDDHCVDALCVKAFLTREDPGDLIEELEHAATTGEKRLGDEFFAEHMGGFWPLVEARPYLRTLKQLAEVLWTVGRRFDAVAYYENLMDLDPGDQMGNARLLLGYYLAMGEVQRSWDLLEEVDDGQSTVYAWAWVLLRLMVEDMAGAREALDNALAANPYVAPWLAGVGDPGDREVPAGTRVVAGSEDEALITLDILGEAWDCDPEAQSWLYDVLVDMGFIADETFDEDEDDAPRPLN